MKTVLIRSDNLLGDTIMQTPGIRALAASGAQVHYLCGTSRGSEQLLHANPSLFRLHARDFNDPQAKTRELYGLYGYGDATAREIGITPAHKHQGMIFNPDETITLDAWAAFQWGREHGRTIAEGFAHRLGVDTTDLRYDLVLTPHEDQVARDCVFALGAGKGPVVFIARHSASCSSNDPAIRVPNKCVENRHWLGVAQWLDRQGYRPVAIGGRGDAEDPRYAEWPYPVLYGEPLRHVAGLLRHAAATLAVDTGIRHLAAAAGGNLYTVSGAIPLELIRCVPNRDGQQVHEEFRPLPYVTKNSLIAGAKQVLP